MVSSSIANKPNLIYLNLSHNRLEKLDRRIFWTVPNMEELNLSHNLLSGGTESLSSCRKLARLDLSANKIPTLGILAPLRLVRSLNTLAIGGNPLLSKPIDLDQLVATVGCSLVSLAVNVYEKDRFKERRESIVKIFKESNDEPKDQLLNNQEEDDNDDDGGNSGFKEKPEKKKDRQPALRIDSKVQKEAANYSGQSSRFQPIERKLDFNNIGSIFTKNNTKYFPPQSREESSVSKGYRLRTTSKQSKPSVDFKTSPFVNSQRDHVFSSEVPSKRKFGTLGKFPSVTPFCPGMQNIKSSGQRFPIKQIAELSLFVDDFKQPELETIVEANTSPTNHDDTLNLIKMIGQPSQTNGIKRKAEENKNTKEKEVYVLHKVSSGLLKTKPLKKVFICRQRKESPPKIEVKNLMPSVNIPADAKLEKTQSIFKIKSGRHSLKQPLLIEIPN